MTLSPLREHTIERVLVKYAEGSEACPQEGRRTRVAGQNLLRASDPFATVV
jgi:hypothetical protein